jgi:hypothetical protein
MLKNPKPKLNQHDKFWQKIFIIIFNNVQSLYSLGISHKEAVISVYVFAQRSQSTDLVEVKLMSLRGLPDLVRLIYTEPIK